MPESSEQDTVTELLNALRSGGHRVTRARQAVLTTIVDARDEHLSTEALAHRIHAHNPEIHLSTVYRTLDFLQSTGVVAHIHRGHQPPTHHLASDVHLHGICDECGATVDLPADLLDSVRLRLRAEAGFALDPGHVALHGLCEQCAAR